MFTILDLYEAYTANRVFSFHFIQNIRCHGSVEFTLEEQRLQQATIAANFLKFQLTKLAVTICMCITWIEKFFYITKKSNWKATEKKWARTVNKIKRFTQLIKFSFGGLRTLNFLQTHPFIFPLRRHKYEKGISDNKSFSLINFSQWFRRWFTVRN